MADDQSFPTAIVPTRPGTAIERYDRLAEQFQDPMLTLFQVQDPLFGHDVEDRIRAAAELLPYRYPKLKLTEIRGGGPGAGGGGLTININVGAAPQPPVIDVTPTPPEEDPLA